MLAGLLLSFNNARLNALAEIASAEKLTLYLFDTAILNNDNQVSPANDLKQFNHQVFRLQGLAHMRHLKIEYVDNAGKVLDSNQPKNGYQFKNEAPAWFEHVLNKMTPPWQPSMRQLKLQGQPFGELVITPDPSYEYAEIWKQITDLFILLSVFFVCVNLMIAWAIAQALKPTEKILLALDEIEKGQLDTRLPTFQLPEIARIGQKFNHMIQTLQQTIFQNHALTQQLITTQEAERKSLARDLHDEFGQCLTAINTDASVILKRAKKQYPELHDSALAIAQLSRHLIDLVSGLLQRLRPGVLDELGLKLALHDLVDTWRARHENISCVLIINNADDLVKDSLNEAESLVLYRLVQECLTNIARHAQASAAEINIATIAKSNDESSEQGIKVQIKDNGIGFNPSLAKGLGLAGMRERVEGLGGWLLLDSSAYNTGLNKANTHADTTISGTTITAWIPLRSRN